MNGKRVNKAGTPVSDEALVEIMAEVPKYVCRYLSLEVTRAILVHDISLV